MRLIDAEEIGLTDFEIVMCGGSSRTALEMLIDKILNAPTIDAEPVKHGEWTEREVFDANDGTVDQLQSAKCSVCGRYHTTPYLYSFHDDNYCPYCGAKMDRSEGHE